jgi:hypothetical protein
VENVVHPVVLLLEGLDLGLLLCLASGLCLDELGLNLLGLLGSKLLELLALALADLLDLLALFPELLGLLVEQGLRTRPLSRTFSS